MIKNLLVTGVSRGVGLRVVEKLLADGHHVYGVARTETERFRDLQGKHEGRLHFKSVDLGNPDGVHKAIFHEFLDLETPVHGVVNNAAMAYDDLVTNLNIELLERMFRVNVFSPMIVVKYAIRNMLLHRIAGSIVHISSISVHTGYKGLAMYASTKGALEAFSKNTAREWGVRMIRSNCVVAGFMETDMSSMLNDEQKDRIYNRTALKRATDVNCVAETVSFLLSNSASSITGQDLFVDSGTI